MPKDGLKYTSLVLFLTGLVLIVFFQFNSGQGVERLIQGNTRLLQELQLKSHLQKLETDIMAVESNIRGAVITEDSIYLVGVTEEIRTIRSEMLQLDEEIQDAVSEKFMNELRRLVAAKLEHSNQILALFYGQGKSAAEDLINTNRGKFLRDSIVNVVQQLDAERNLYLTGINESIDKSSANARTWGMILAIIGCLICVLAFWYIVNQSRQRQVLIIDLNRSQEELRKASAVKEQFLANMSHEMRTPMNAIVGFTNMLDKSGMQGEQQKFVQHIKSAGENLLALINDILDLEKIEAGMMRIEQVPFGLRALMHSIETMFAERAREKNLALLVQVEEEVPDHLLGDPVRLTQVLVNLLSNAIKFTHRGEVRVLVDATRQKDEYCSVRFRVSDTGIGIGEKHLERIFDRFQQAEADTTRNYGGTGLGLSIVKQLCRLQNGSVQVASKPGEGSEFIVEIPYRLYVATQKEAAPANGMTGLSGINKQARIIVAEDNPMNQQLLNHLLEHARFPNLRMVENGKQLCEAMEVEKFDLVLMDIQMPEMDGYAATRYIRNDLGLETPIIAMTAHAMAGEKEKCIAAGMNDYVSKPINEHEFFGAMARYIPRAATYTHNGVIDLHYLRGISAGNIGFEQEMIRQFIDQVPHELSLLSQAVNNNDYTLIRVHSHNLKSSVAYLGLSPRLSGELDQLEKIHSTDSQADIRGLYLRVESICVQAVREARRLAEQF